MITVQVEAIPAAMANLAREAAAIAPSKELADALKALGNAWRPRPDLRRPLLSPDQWDHADEQMTTERGEQGRRVREILRGTPDGFGLDVFQDVMAVHAVALHVTAVLGAGATDYGRWAVLSAVDDALDVIAVLLSERKRWKPRKDLYGPNPLVDHDGWFGER